MTENIKALQRNEARRQSRLKSYRERLRHTQDALREGQIHITDDGVLVIVKDVPLSGPAHAGDSSKGVK